MSGDVCEQELRQLEELAGTLAALPDTDRVEAAAAAVDLAARVDAALATAMRAGLSAGTQS